MIVDLRIRIVSYVTPLYILSLHLPSRGCLMERLWPGSRRVGRWRPQAYDPPRRHQHGANLSLWGRMSRDQHGDVHDSNMIQMKVGAGMLHLSELQVLRCACAVEGAREVVGKLAYY